MAIIGRLRENPSDDAGPVPGWPNIRCRGYAVQVEQYEPEC